jgi:hypothetical protein
MERRSKHCIRIPLRRFIANSAADGNASDDNGWPDLGYIAPAVERELLNVIGGTIAPVRQGAQR